MIIAQSKNPDELLKPGMSGRMSIEVLYGEQAIVCHRNAISGSPTAPFVFLERSSGRYERRFVKLGTSVGDKVEIREGLFPGDKVVVVGTGVMTSFFPQRSINSDNSVKADKTKKSVVRNPQEHPQGKSGTSTIEAFGEVEVPVHNRHFAATQLEGRISRILVRPGVEVKTGQVLAEVASLPYYELQLELLRNLARYRWIRERKDRLSSLQESQTIRKVDLWEAETELIVIEHATAEIRAQLKALGMDEPALKSIEANGLDPLKRASSGTMSIPVRAPADGRLDYFEITPGEVVRPTESGVTQPSKPLFEIHDRSKVWVCAHVRESQVSQLRIGQNAKVTFPAMPGKNVTGKVVRISPVIDPKTRVIAIWIEAENPDGHFFDNMQAKVIIETGSPGIIEADDSN
jgi:multidrug efflux pump subunit AcrA (membrane-fusion protein)